MQKENGGGGVGVEGGGRREKTTQGFVERSLLKIPAVGFTFLPFTI